MNVSVSKVAISLDERLLRRLDDLVEREIFRSRSEAIGKAVREKLARFDRTRLARECAKLSPAEEHEMAEEGISAEAAEMAGILRGDIVWADLDPTQCHEQSGRRPVLILSRDVFNERSER